MSEAAFRVSTWLMDRAHRPSDACALAGFASGSKLGYRVGMTAASALMFPSRLVGRVAWALAR